MEEETEFKKLPVEERVVHKLWKARVHGYEELAKLFRQIDDEKSPEFAKYLGVIKKFVIDSNAMGQEKGLEATLAYVENYANAGKSVGEVMSGIVTKCIAAPKTKTRELAVQITLMYVEIEKQEQVLEELLKGMDSKNPKIVAACITCTTLSLHEFGSKVVNVKPLIKKMPILLSDRDKAVRDEGKAMVIEIYRWIGNALRSMLANLQPVQVTELETEFAKVSTAKVVPSRYLRSQQQRQAKMAIEAGGDVDENDDEDAIDAPVDIDPYDLADPVNILAKLPHDFYEKVEAKKWQERKEAVEAVEKLVSAPKLESGDYGDLVRALKKIISKDSNVMVVALAGKCLAGLANGLKKRFSTYAGACIPALLEKFREKKQNVVLALREALDAIFISTTLEAMVEDVLEALNNKNPAVKAETASFLARAFTKCQPTALNKKMLKAYTGALLKTLNEPDPTVRDFSAEALGTAMKLVGDKAIAPFVVEVDNLKMAKIKECCEKAVITVKVAAAKRERPVTAPVKSDPPKAGSTTAKPVKRPSSAAKGKTRTVKVVDQEMSAEEIEEKALEIFDPEILNTFADANWKVRLEAVEKYQEAVKQLEANSVSAQILVGVLCMKPGLKDTNIQVLKYKLETLKIIAETHKFSNISANMCLHDVIDKLGDAKNGSIAADALTAIAEATKLEHVANVVLDYAFNQKSPKIQQESLLWVGNAIKEFGFVVNTKYITEMAKKGVGATNPAVRTSAITLCGVLYLYMGPTLHMFFESEKPALRQQINAEFDKYDNEKPPEPIRGLKNKAVSVDALNEIDEDEESNEPAFSVHDLMPRVDISGQITEALITELCDKNWKVRNEALIKIQTILSENKFIESNIADLPQALAQRLVDSNGKIAQTAIQISETLATAMGPPCKQYVRVLFPGFLQGLSDTKTWIRSASINCINTWGDLCGYKEFFESEMIADALKAGSPTLRIELFAWLADKLGKVPLKQISKDELLICIPHVYLNLEDRNADVRKNAQEAILPFMIHLGYETMCKQTEKLKPGSKTVVLGVLEKARPNLPMKPLPKNKQQAPIEPPKGAKVVKGASKPAGKVRTSTSSKAAPARKKDDDIDLSPLLMLNNLKHQRVIDEQKLRVLKWNFNQPRDEFVELLKDQMTAANVNKNLMANMFHADFRYHLKAIESLTEDIPCNTASLIANLDLVLKWLTLRFFDTNPSVLLKGLEYLQIVFNMLVENGHHLLENEASSFIPYLILKVGDPKDAVRNGVRALFKQIALIYPVSKLFSYIMDGLKSKNARQRTECLEELGALIEDYGILVCQPSPAAALKEVAKQISDRDNSVRNSALNCIVQAFFIEGERVFKMVGHISDKDMSLLEERIKRATKKGIPQRTSRNTMLPQQLSQQAPIAAAAALPPQLQREPSDLDSKSDDDINEMPAPVISRRVSPPRPVSGPYGLDPHLLKQIEGPPVRVMKPQLIEMDLNFLAESPLASTEKPRIMPINPPKRILPSQPFSARTNVQSLILNPRVGQELLLEKTINQIGNPDLTVAIAAIQQMETILQSNKINLMIEFENQFMSAITLQLKLLHSQNPQYPDVSKTYRAILTVMSAFYDGKVLGRRVSRDVVKDILHQLLTLLVDTKLENFDGNDAYHRVINVQCVRIIENTDHTNIICALIKLLYDCVSSSYSARFLDLVMKCLWRVIKIIPTWSEEMDYDTILYEIHLFFKDFPSTWWKQKPSDTPNRTIKTLVHSMAKIKGNTLTVHLSQIANPNESELQSYLLKLIKTLKLEEVKQIPLKKDMRRPLSRTTHNMLTEIFRKIGSKEATKEGLTLLYDFQLQHPEADIEPYLEKSSKFFQEYIENGLKDIETSRKKAEITAGISSQTSTDSRVQQNTNQKDQNEYSEYWMERLKKWNIASSTSTGSNALDNKLNDENLNIPRTIASHDLNQTKDHDFQTTLTSAEETTKKFEEIRRRIEMMKTTNAGNQGK